MHIASKPSRALATLACFTVTLAVCCGLWWPVPAHLDTLRPLTAFGDSHVWVMETLRGQLVSGELSDRVCGPGYPHERTLRALAWAPTLVYTLLRVVLQPLAAANVVQLISLPLSSLAAMALIRRWTPADPWTAAALGAVYGLCPTLLATLASAEISNTQAWILPLFLLALHSAMRSWWGLLAMVSVAIAATFTSPYYALALPLFAGGMVLARAVQARALVPREWLSIPALALAQAPALWYYKASSTGGTGSMFRPAKRGEILPLEIAKPPPIAQLDQLVVDTMASANELLRPVHVSSIGLALVVAALLAVIWKSPGWKRSLILALGGVLLSLGPALYVAEGLVRVGEVPLYLPVQLLELAGWPTRNGGMYYRYAVIAVLGCTLLAASALSTRRWGAPAAWLLLLAQVGQGVWETGPHWPRPSQQVIGRSQMLALSGPEMGAVVELPFQTATDADLGQPALLRAVFHGQPTTALPRGSQRPDPALKKLVKEALVLDPPERALEQLRENGVSAVVLDTRAQEGRVPALHTLRHRLGEPEQVGHLLIWVAGPSEGACLPPASTGMPRAPKGGKAPPPPQRGKAPPRR